MQFRIFHEKYSSFQNSGLKASQIKTNEIMTFMSNLLSKFYNQSYLSFRKNAVNLRERLI